MLSGIDWKPASVFRYNFPVLLGMQSPYHTRKNTVYSVRFIPLKEKFINIERL
ncbi:hypothetical protein HMPREF0658_0816 [Hoylesella marshii DSM 16973 = JCM 13450]|uniref:Uncharacterized protein n=1 Tax=Hoylesella marshii DSM 16973 = JCM 13450 TaxID=862515 RepID=E0NRL5_9BACT|nr:hypothetical protein HMPREF0658_0816 [Hoylesella marshii DSM 16973 = JCM 13450]